MARSKKIKRDEKGSPIVPGGKTFGNVIKLASGGQHRGHDLRSRAADRILRLMKFGSSIDRFTNKVEPRRTKQEQDALDSHNEFARLSYAKQFAHHSERRAIVLKELQDLEAHKNARKIAFVKPAIQMELRWIEEQMEEIYFVWKRKKLNF